MNKTRELSSQNGKLQNTNFKTESFWVKFLNRPILEGRVSRTQTNAWENFIYL